jgi:hypothetical protein
MLLIEADVCSDVGGADVEAGGELGDSVDLVEHRGHGRIKRQLYALEREGVAAGLEGKGCSGGQGKIEDVVAAPNRVVDGYLRGKHGGVWMQC